jgi:hypothetical protein
MIFLAPKTQEANEEKPTTILYIHKMSRPQAGCYIDQSRVCISTTTMNVVLHPTVHTYLVIRRSRRRRRGVGGKQGKAATAARARERRGAAMAAAAEEEEAAGEAEAPRPPPRGAAALWLRPLSIYI